MRAIFAMLKRGWMKFAFVLGWVNSRIILTVLYIILFAPIAIIRQMILLFYRGKKESYWIEKEQKPATVESLRHPF